MKKKDYQLAGKKTLGINITVQTVLLFMFCSFTNYVSGTDISVWPYEIKFNYEPGQSNDAITILDEDGDTAPVPEWEYNGGSAVSEKFAYIKSQSSRKIQVRFDSNCDSMHLLINLNVVSGTGIGEVCNYFVANYDKLDWITLTLDGTIPNSVGTRSFTWTWTIYAISKNSSYCSDECTYNTQHTYYTLYSTPQAPMTQPWSSVLDYACDWASGQTTAEDISNEITESLYTSGFYYDVDEGAPQYGANWSTFLLTDFLSDISSTKEVNCLDMAKAVAIFSNALGTQLVLTRFHSSLGVVYPLNYIDPIGSALPTNNTFRSQLIDNDCRTGGFGYHAFVENANSMVWDATLRYDTDIDPDNVYNSNPSCGYYNSGGEWELPCNTSESTYLNHLIDNWTKYDNDFVIDCDNPSDCGYEVTNGISVE